MTSSGAGLQSSGSAASSEIFGLVAHELRQPLSNIESIAYYLSLVLARNDEKVQEQLTRIRQLVEQSNWILSSGLRLTGSASPAPESLDLEELVTHSVSSAGPQPNLRLELAGNLPLVQLDPRQGRELVDTLMMLIRPVTTKATPAILRTSAGQAGAVLEVLVSPAGIESSLGAGSELCVESARKIAQTHGGTLECQLDPAIGIRISVMLP
jgi:signal transduction histidine kinase